jgi:hypothetical protein
MVDGGWRLRCLIDRTFDGGAERCELGGEFVDSWFLGFGGVLETGGEEDLGSHLGQGCGRDCREAKEIRVRIPGLAFGGVRWARNGGSAELGGESEALGGGKAAAVR